jgi:hypothetical protein
MDCRDCQDELLRSESLSPDSLPPGEISAHVAGCGVCRQWLRDLSHLERAWSEIPLPAGAERPPASFLHRLANQEPPIRRSRSSAPRWLVAASILLVIAVGGGLLIRPSRASADIVERLVDWNLSLARSPSPADRDRLYEDQVAGLKAEVLKARLLDGDRGLAESLLETAPWLARNDDPLAEVDRFNDVADQLLARLSLASRGGDNERVERYARLFRRVRELGIESKLDVLEATGALNFDRQRKLERLVLRDANRMRDLVALLERAPESSRKEIKRALGVVKKRNRAMDTSPAADRRKGQP